MNPPPSYRNHLEHSESLKTPYEATRAGFVALALEKNRLGSPYVDQARSLKTIASRAPTPAGLLELSDIKPSLLSAAGISKKAEKHMRAEDLDGAIREFIENYLEPAGGDFVEELVYRFLLTKGDALGGQIRNLAGVLARRKFTRAIISSLAVKGIEYKWLRNNSQSWLQSTPNDTDIEDYLKSLSWTIGNDQRTIVYNIKVPLVGKQIDVILLNCDGLAYRTSIRNPRDYIALGELKGGFDPAGADEHWKTATAALIRIRTEVAKSGLNPLTFFVGAAIVDDMAGEIWDQLRRDTLANAANLTDPDQIASLCDWLTGL
jgi:hypothetical protein